MNKLKKLSSLVLVFLLTSVFCAGLLFTVKSVNYKGYAEEDPFMVSLNVGKDISLKFTASVPDNVTDLSMNFQWAGTQQYNKTYTVANEDNYQKNSDGTVTFTYRGITPQYMGKTIAAKLSYKESGKTTATEKNVSTSVKAYCEKLISSSEDDLKLSTEATAQVKKLAVDILNYGATAQTYTNTDAENLVNSGKTGGSEFSEFSSDLENEKSTSGNGISAWHRGISFDYKMNPVVKFSLADAQVAGTLSSKIEMDGNTVATPTPVANNNEYEITYKNFNILNIDKSYKITVYNNGTSIGSYTDSLASIVFSQKDLETPIAKLIKNSYVYAKSAELYSSLINAVKFEVLPDGTTFTTEGVWSSFDDTTGVGEVRKMSDITDAQGNLKFTAATASRMNMFNVAKRTGDVWIGLADNYTSNILPYENDISSFFGKEYSYTMGIQSTGKFELVFLATMKAYNKNLQNSMYLDFSDNGKIDYTQIGKSSKSTGNISISSNGEFSANSSFAWNQTNTLTLKLTRLNSSDIFVKLEVNGVKVNFQGTASLSDHFVLDDGGIKIIGAFQGNGFGPRIGFVPQDSSVVTVSSMKFASK